MRREAREEAEAGLFGVTKLSTVRDTFPTDDCTESWWALALLLALGTWARPVLILTGSAALGVLGE